MKMTKNDNLEENKKDKNESFKNQLIAYFENSKLHNIYCGFKKGQLHFDLENMVYDKNSSQYYLDILTSSNQYYITVEFEAKNDEKINENRISLFPKMKGIESMMEIENQLIEFFKEKKRWIYKGIINGDIKMLLSEMKYNKKDDEYSIDLYSEIDNEVFGDVKYKRNVKYKIDTNNSNKIIKSSVKYIEKYSSKESKSF